MLLLVGLTIGEHVHTLSWSGVLLLLGQIAGFILVTWVLASRVIPLLIEWLERLLKVPHLSFGLTLGILLVAVVCAEKFGLHGSLGALLLGVALSRLPHQVQRDIFPGLKSIADGFFVPLFFSSADQWIVPHQQDYVVVEDDKLVGIVSLAMLRYVPRHSWSDTRLGTVARQSTPNTWPDERVEDALQRMTEGSLSVLPVMKRESRELAGAITSHEILELITAEARGGS